MSIARTTLKSTLVTTGLLAVFLVEPAQAQTLDAGADLGALKRDAHMNHDKFRLGQQSHSRGANFGVLVTSARGWFGERQHSPIWLPLHKHFEKKSLSAMI